jgi:1-pyrroline-5-carboxylate dehydrogenase
MTASIVRVPTPSNEPVLGYAPGSPEQVALAAELQRQAGEVVDIPCVIGGRRVYTGNVWTLTNPSAHGEVLARVHLAGPAEVAAALDAARQAKAAWAAAPWSSRAAVLLRAATLLAGPGRARVNAATMLGQAKTAHQAEIDAACELIDFLALQRRLRRKLQVRGAAALGAGHLEPLEYRPLDGFVFAVTPFNFTSIAGNLPTAPALMGNVVLWKPASTSALSAGDHEAAARGGAAAGRDQLRAGHGPTWATRSSVTRASAACTSPGSTGCSSHMWRSIGENIARYRTYPRSSARPAARTSSSPTLSADVEALAVALVRGAFEYQGQKCSAASRAYIPSTPVAAGARAGRGTMMAEAKMGDVRDFRNFFGAVIDRALLRQDQEEIPGALGPTGQVIGGGGSATTRRAGSSSRPSSVDDPGHRLMTEELFGPVLTACSSTTSAALRTPWRWCD